MADKTETIGTKISHIDTNPKRKYFLGTSASSYIHRHFTEMRKALAARSEADREILASMERIHLLLDENNTIVEESNERLKRTLELLDTI